MKFSPHTISRTWRSRQGSALILVVVLIVLLALMGTAFLFAMRAARVQADAAGNPKLMQGEWPVVDPAGLTNTAASILSLEVEKAIKDSVINGTGVYLDPTSSESRATDPKESLYLADRIPVSEYEATGTSADAPYMRWQFVTGIYGDATRHNTISGTTAANQDLFVAQYPYQYPAAGSWPVMADGITQYPSWAQEALAGRTRLFPAFVEYANKASADPSNVLSQTNKFIAADADGDGIPDSLLTNTGQTGALVGVSGTVHFWKAVRIVDNNAALNINTAWRSTADRDFTGTDLDQSNPLYGYLGTFRANAGLKELIAGGQTDNTAIMTNGEAETDIGLLEGYRFANNYPTLQTIYTGADSVNVGTAFPTATYQRLTAAEAMEMGLARRVSPSMKPGFYSTSKRFGIFNTNEQDQLAYHFIMANPAFTSSLLTQVFNNALLVYAPNTRSGVPIPQSGFFGANQQDFWNYTNLNTDNTAGGSRDNFFTTYNSTNYPTPPNTRFTLANVRKTIREDLVGVNGVTVSRPANDPPTLTAATTTQGNWDTASPGIAQMADYADTPAKVWVNGATFGELWRAYYGLFKATGTNPVQVTRLPPTSFPAGGSGAWDADRQLLLRSAIAAVNTIQARQPMTADAVARIVSIDGVNIRLYGSKRQPFITEVMVETGRVDPAQPESVANPIETKWVAIQLHNPYADPIDISHQQLFYVSGTGTWSLAADLAGQGLIPAGGLKVILAKRPSYSDAGTPVAGLPTIGAANGVLLDSYPMAGGASASIRLVAWDGTTAATANGYDMIPQDEVGILPSLSATQPQRTNYVRPTLTAAPANSRFCCVYNAPAVFVTATDSAAPGSPPSWDTTINGSLNADNAGTGLATDNLLIQVGNYSPYAASNTVFPFGGFARDGDLLHVAFIGNCAYVNGATSYTCSVGRDAYWAEDGDATDNDFEAVGHFVPLKSLAMKKSPPWPTAEVVPAVDYYDWAGRLFDFVTSIQHPGSELNPDVFGLLGAETLSNSADRCIQGRVNINTAPWQVLAALPLIPGNKNVTGAYDLSTPDNVQKERDKLAKAIVADRLANGPFHSIFELNRVTDFAWKAAGCSAQTDLLNRDLDIAPLTGTSVGCGDISVSATTHGDNAIGDSEQRTLGITRISNLITTRSDSFNVYILIQAWLDGTNTAYPVMVGEQRFMYLIDRTALTKGGGSLYVKQLVEK